MLLYLAQQLCAVIILGVLLCFAFFSGKPKAYLLIKDVWFVTSGGGWRPD